MYSTEMALSQSTSFRTFQIPFHKHQFIGTAHNRRTMAEIPRYPLISSFHKARSKPCSPLRTISCVAGEASSPSSPISSVFVKGLADSVSEGRLRKVFTEFGEVSNVKIIINEKTRLSLGYGYVWFNNKEDAQLAVEAMNGKILLTKACSLISGLSTREAAVLLSKVPTKTRGRVASCS